MLGLRLLTTAVGLPLVLLAILLGPHPFSIFLAVVAAVCTLEICKLAPGSSRRDPLAVVATLWAVILATRHILIPSSSLQNLAITVPLIVALVLLLPHTHRNRTFTQWSWMIAGALYVGWLFGHWGALYLLPGGRDLVLFGVIATFAYDSFAYFSGRAFGRHHVAPRISAAKTWEGAAGGLAATVVIGLLVRMALIAASGSFPFTISLTVAITFFVVLAALVGDLVESALKRSVGAKDAGVVLPGHGGMLDRFDSLLFVGPMLYYVSLWMAI